MSVKCIFPTFFCFFADWIALLELIFPLSFKELHHHHQLWLPGGESYLSLSFWEALRLHVGWHSIKLSCEITSFSSEVTFRKLKCRDNIIFWHHCFLELERWKLTILRISLLLFTVNSETSEHINVLYFWFYICFSLHFAISIPYLPYRNGSFQPQIPVYELLQHSHSLPDFSSA